MNMKKNIFFTTTSNKIYVVGVSQNLKTEDHPKLEWLFGDGQFVADPNVNGFFVGPRKEMITPWSTNAVEITQNMGIDGIERIEEFIPVPDQNASFDAMTESLYEGLGQGIFTILRTPDTVENINDLEAYNISEGLALSDQEIEYLQGVATALDRPLTDSEVFGFSQVNSEHCRHKIFNGQFIIDGQVQPHSLFEMIKKTSKMNPNKIVSAYGDNVAFVGGPRVEQFAPTAPEVASEFITQPFDSVISLKAETHNFPTTVEPFNGAATGAGGEIRDRMAGGKGSMPLAGTAVYMTSYSRLNPDRSWESQMGERDWLYQSPMDILIKASNGASDFGNKFGQPLINGSVLTFEHQEAGKRYGYDKVVMQAGGIGYAKRVDALKDTPNKGDKIVVMGGDNYRIGMGGGAVSSVATGEFSSGIELNAVQRSNPEMQKRVYNVVRALSEQKKNPIVSIHDHGAGGHLNCLSELVEETGGVIEVTELPIGDPTLSDKEIIGNESQERMGLVMEEKDMAHITKIATRERAPIYVVGEVTDDHTFVFENKNTGIPPMKWDLAHMFGSSPKTILTDTFVPAHFDEVTYNPSHLMDYINNVLQLESVACKDWLTNKVDRCVTGRVAKQQTAGPIQLPLNNLGVMALDYRGEKGVATSIGHAPIAGLIDPFIGGRVSIAEALTNIIWAPIDGGIKGISLSANWMWPAKQDGENARIYKAVQGVSDFACALGINIPTGKDSLSMTQKYADGEVYAPGTVIISAVGEVSDLKRVVEPVLKPNFDSVLIYIDLSEDAFHLGGSSFAQTRNKIGVSTPDIKSPAKFAATFDAVQQSITEGMVLAGHDISAGGMITTLLEMTFAEKDLGLNIDLSAITGADDIQLLFSEKSGIIIQVDRNHIQEITQALDRVKAKHYTIGKVIGDRIMSIKNVGKHLPIRY